MHGGVTPLTDLVRSEKGFLDEAKQNGAFIRTGNEKLCLVLVSNGIETVMDLTDIAIQFVEARK